MGHSAEKDAPCYQLPSGWCSKHDPTPETTDAFCSECLSLMVEDNGAGHLCPVCDEHPAAECGNGFPCSGFDGKPCVLNEQLGTRVIPPGVPAPPAEPGADRGSES